MILIRVFYSTQSFTILNENLFQTHNVMKHILMIAKATEQFLGKNVPFFEPSIDVFMTSIDASPPLNAKGKKYCVGI